MAVNGETVPLVSHTPVIARQDEDGIVLRFHLSAANPATARLIAGAAAGVAGADAYISPDWYGNVPDQVPTWNYLSVEAEGEARETGREGAAAFLDDLSAVFEGALLPKPPWTRDKMKPAAFEAMLGGIHAFEMRPRRLEGITKLGQNKTAEMRAGVIEALEGLPGGAGIAAAMRRLA